MNDNAYLNTSNREQKMSDTPFEYDETLDADTGYQEWSETIEKQNQQAQDESLRVIDLSGCTWSEVLTKLLPVA